MEWHSSEGFLLSSGGEDPLLIQIFEVGAHSTFELGKLASYLARAFC